jgi:hypothetical protein
MELTEKERIYLELYKGINQNGMDALHPEMNPNLRAVYSHLYSHNNINAFINFVNKPTKDLLQKVIVDEVDGMTDMVLTLSDLACRNALEHPLAAEELYRMENTNNLHNYDEEGTLTSFKSTSKSDQEVQIFNKPDTVGLSFTTEGYIPYIDVDKVIKPSYFSDEGEILFPPGIKGSFTGNSTTSNGTHFTEVKLKDDFEKEHNDPNKTNFAYYAKQKELVAEVLACRSTNNISDKLITDCNIVANYMNTKLRNMYSTYKEFYEKQQGQIFTK